MTNEQAKAIFLLEYCSQNCGTQYRRHCDNCEINFAIKALEKQIPKKPICVEDKMWSCPVCYNNLLHKWIKYPIKLMPKTEGLPHCMSCGQAIDWSEEE